MGRLRPALLPVRPDAYLCRRAIASLPLLLAAQCTGEKRMCSPVYLLMLPVCEKLVLLTGYTAWARGPSNSIARCSVLSDYALADGAEGLHFSVI